MNKTFVFNAKINGDLMEVWEFQRPGTDSEPYIYLKHNGRWITPFEQRVRNISISLTDLLKLCYADVLTGLLNADDSLLYYVPLDTNPGSHSVPAPIKFT